jgi:RNA polymerase sigma factor for flagellar operon FliA
MPVRTSPKRRTHATSKRGSARPLRDRTKSATTKKGASTTRVARAGKLSLVRKASPVRKATPRIAARKPAAKANLKPVVARPAPLALVPAREAAPAPRKGVVLMTRAEEAAATGPIPRVPREQLLERYTPLVKYVVERLAVGLPKNVDHADLRSAGVLGLLDAYDKFDAGKGTKFETYAVWRIKGAVLDQLRALDWASRSVRRKAREVDASMRRLDQRLGRQASEEEIAKEAKMPLADYHRLMDQVRGAVLLSLDEVRAPEDGDSLGLADVIEDPSTPDVLAKIEEEETRQVLLETLNQLPEQERLVVALYYYEHMTLREIGLTLGISESRVSQVHSRAVQRLKGRVKRALAA